MQYNNILFDAIIILIDLKMYEVLCIYYYAYIDKLLCLEMYPIILNRKIIVINYIKSKTKIQTKFSLERLHIL